jgi:hypothetical protein
MEFQYIKDRYKVPAEMNREIIMNGKKGVITKDMGNYIGVNFYDNVTADPLPCHPTWEMEYLETFNYKPPIKKTTASQKRYREFLRSDSGLSFSEWLGIKPKNRYTY